MRSNSLTSPASFPIGELSRQTGVNIETIRYYERIRILPPPTRTTSGRRVYGPAETRTLTSIRRSRELGFSLDEIRALLALSADDGEDTCAEVRQLSAGHLADVRAKLADLHAMERVLVEAVRRCDAGELPGCPMIDALTATAPLSPVRRRVRQLATAVKHASALDAQKSFVSDPHRPRPKVRSRPI